jgi:hypothetical protein
VLFVSRFLVSIGVFISKLLPSDLSDFPSAGFAAAVAVPEVAAAEVAAAKVAAAEVAAAAGVVVTVLA